MLHYGTLAAIAGGVAGAVTLIRFVGLVYPRATSDPIGRNTTRVDFLTYLLLAVLIVMGCWMTFAHNLATHAPCNYRDSTGAWWRSIFHLHPDVAAKAHAPLVYQLHAIIAWLFWASFPFSRLVYAWSIPVQYIGHPYVLCRRRYSTAR